jgi:hypothetical protein
VPLEQNPLEELAVKEDPTYKEYLVRILETTERVTRSCIIRMCKVQWNRYTVEETIWKREEYSMLRVSTSFY